MRYISFILIGLFLAGCAKSDKEVGIQTTSFVESAVSNGGNDLSLSLDTQVRELFVEYRSEFLAELPKEERKSFSRWLKSAPLRITVIEAPMGNVAVHVRLRENRPTLAIDSAFSEMLVEAPYLTLDAEIGQLWDALVRYATLENVLDLGSLEPSLNARNAGTTFLLAPLGISNLKSANQSSVSKDKLETLITSAARLQLLPRLKNTGLPIEEEKRFRALVETVNFHFELREEILRDDQGNPGHGRVLPNGAIEISVPRWVSYFSPSGEMNITGLGMLLHETLRSAYFRGFISKNDDFNVITLRVLNGRP